MKIKLTILEKLFLTFLAIVLVAKLLGVFPVLESHFEKVSQEYIKLTLDNNPGIPREQIDMQKELFELLKESLIATYYALFVLITLPIYYFYTRKSFTKLPLPSSYFLLIFVSLASIILLFNEYDFSFLKNILSMMFFNYIIVGVAIFVYMISLIFKDKKLRVLNYILTFLLLTRLRSFFFLIGIADHWVDLRKKTGGLNGDNIDKRL